MDERRLLLAALLSLAVITLWQVVFPSPRGPVAPSAEEETEASGGDEHRGGEAGERSKHGQPETPIAQPETGEPSLPREEVAPPPVEVAEASVEVRLEVESPEYRAEFSNLGAQLISFELKNHLDSVGNRLDLVRARVGGGYPFSLVGRDRDPLPLNDELFVASDTVDDDGRRSLAFLFSDGKVSCEKRFRFLPSGLFDMEVEVKGQGMEGWGLVLGPGVRNPSAEELEGRYQVRSAVYRSGGEVETVRTRGAKEATELPGGSVQWIGLEDTYFLTALIPRQPVDRVVVEPVLFAPDSEGGFSYFPLPRDRELSEEEKELTRELRVILQTGGGHLALTAYWGAKYYERLAAMPYGLEETVEWGVFGFLSRPLLWILLWIHDQVVPNYGWAIVVMTVLLKVVLLPLTHKSTVSMQKMQQLNPKVQAIRQKYRGKLRDKQGRFNAESQRKMNEELQELYRSEGVNPAGGCLPILLQIPVFFAFFRLLPSAVELRQAPWIFWVRDLSAPDPYYVLPLIMGASQLLQQKLTPAAGDPMQRRMMQILPIMFVIFAFGFPSGLVLYWLVNNILSIAQVALYNRWKEKRAKA